MSARAQMVDMIALYFRHAADRIGIAHMCPEVREVMARVPRHEFVPHEIRAYAYLDTPLPIGFDKTISQPFMVALMTELLEVRSAHRVLEVGTGHGYQAAILAELGHSVCTVEIVEELAAQAKRNLARLDYDNVEIRVGDGSKGWAERAPFDRILVAAAPELIPPLLFHQLKPQGRMVIPAGHAERQTLTLVEKDEAGHIRTREVLPVRFSALESYP